MCHSGDMPGAMFKKLNTKKPDLRLVLVIQKSCRKESSDASVATNMGMWRRNASVRRTAAEPATAVVKTSHLAGSCRAALRCNVSAAQNKPS